MRVDPKQPKAGWESLSPTRQAGIRAASPLVDLGTVAVLLFIGFAVRDHATTNQLIVWLVGTVAIGLIRHFVWKSTRWEDLQPGRITRPDLVMAGTSLMLGLWLVYFWRTMVPPDDAVVIGVCLTAITAWWATSISVLSASPLAFATVSLCTASAPLIGAIGRTTAFDGSLWLMVLLAGGISISYVDRRQSYLRSIRAEEGVRRRAAEITLAFAAITDGVLVTEGSVVVRTNPAMSTLLEVPASEIRGRTLANIFGTEAGRLASGARARIEVPRRGRAPWVAEVVGSETDELDEGVVVWMCRDVTDLVNQESRLRNLADQDDLTGLSNRRGLLAALARPPTDRSGRAVLVVDVDRFKNINDDNGHAVGDEVLRRVAERLQRRVGSTGAVFRPGGDEFVVVASCAGRAAAEYLAVELVADGRAPVAVGGDGRLLVVTVSVGMAYTDTHVGGQDLLHRADLAMYEAKQAGRNGWRASSADLSGPT